MISRRALLLSTLAVPATPAVAKQEAAIRGMNVPDLAEEGSKVPLVALKELRKHGLNHIRAPVHAERLMPAFSSSTAAEQYCNLLRRDLSQILDLGFSVTIDLHGRRPFSTLHASDDRSASDQIVAAWRQLKSVTNIAAPNKISCEILNEPNVPDARWRKELVVLLPRIRELHPANLIIIGPAPYQRFDALTEWEPFPFANVTYAFHYYDPMIFTHQGQTWDRAAPTYSLSSIPFPTSLTDPHVQTVVRDLRARADAGAIQSVESALVRPWTPDRIVGDLDRVAKWRDQHNVAVQVNEFGVLQDKAPRQSRLLWIRTVRAAAERLNLGWVYWSLAGGFGVSDPSERLDGLAVKCLLPN
jgi:endoglucanase